MNSPGFYVLWGDRQRSFEINGKLLSYILSSLRIPYSNKVWDGYYHIEDNPVDQSVGEKLAKCISQEHISFDLEKRFRHSIGKGGTDYATLMEGRQIRLVDAVVYPNREELICLVSSISAEFGLISFGGGTTVTGGVNPSNSKKYYVSIDASNLDHILIHKDYMTVEAGGGVLGPRLEEELNKNGLTLGHFPESFLHSTVGGWIATNAAGQESNKYGKMRDLVSGVELVTPSGIFNDRTVPNDSAFFQTKDIAVGSEGTFGVIASARLKVRNQPTKLIFKSYIFNNFEKAVNSMSESFRAGKVPMVARLSDPVETHLSLLGADDTFMMKIFRNYLGLRNVGNGGSLLVMVDEKGRNQRIDGGIRLGPTPAVIWRKTRYDRPYMYNELLKYGIIADTIETAAVWPGIMPLYSEVNEAFRRSLEDTKADGIIMCHLSHEYSSGSALYFTFLFHSDSRKVETLLALRKSIMDTILSNGGAISHHHGIGRAFSDSLEKYKGNSYELLKAIKNKLDPENIMNPGILDV
jgi:alkyldihydroxyacetonephosphate synthase